MKDKKSVFCIALVVLLVSTPLLVYQTAAEELDYQNITVQEAKNLIEESPNTMILDVRNSSEFAFGHLYNATSLPVHVMNVSFNLQTQTQTINGTTAPVLPIDSRVLELQQHINDTVIVYCLGGSRSPLAAQMLVDNNFTNVYNVIGGITSWLNAGYPISTSYHHITVDYDEQNRTIVDIDPLLLYQNCVSCQDSSRPCGTTPKPNVNSTVLEQYENRTVVLVQSEFNGTYLEYTTDRTILWSQGDTTELYNRTTTFNTITTIKEGISTQTITLYLNVAHEDYTLSISTILMPLDAQTYNASLTVVDFIPNGKTEKITLEDIRFNNSVTLSELYQDLSRVTEKLAENYAEEEDESLTIFAERYYIIADELTLLSERVQEEIPQYDYTIIHNSAIIIDDWFHCAICQFAFQVAIQGGCAAIAACTVGWGYVICMAIFNTPDQWGLGTSYVCENILDCWNSGQLDYNYITWTDEYEYNADVNNHEYIRGNSINGFRAQLWCPNAPAMGQIIGTFDEEYVHGLISLYGWSADGYYSHLYVYVSNDASNWKYVSDQYISGGTIQWMDCGYEEECFKYICIVGYNSGFSVNLYLDCCRVTP